MVNGRAYPGAAGSYTYLDNVRVTSLDAIFNSGITGSGVNGNPTGAAAYAAYAAELAQQAVYAQAFGLRDVAYEGGWAVGGGALPIPLDSYAKYVDPRAGQDTARSLTDFEQAGGALYLFGTFWSWYVSPADDSSGYWPGDNSAGYPIPSAIAASAQALPAAPTNGFIVPAALAPFDNTWTYNDHGRHPQRQQLHHLEHPRPRRRRLRPGRQYHPGRNRTAGPSTAPPSPPEPVADKPPAPSRSPPACTPSWSSPSAGPSPSPPLPWPCTPRPWRPATSP